ncbi:Tad domain-containing protein [Oceanobacillus damuensis]|uniref:Tad domain-containing protein n=1 Tax=Oceanobacillus damuensis TaxID=937928 RepID=UPI00082DB0BD|nr:Tad domain-containing protein [Oceanobacillus damuensis]
MKETLKNRLNNEEGNIALFVLGMLGFIMILFVFVMNMGMALAVKEQSATTAQQASMAASSVLYDEVQEIVFGFDYEGVLPEEDPEEDSDEVNNDEPEEEDLPFENLEEKINELAVNFQGNGRYSGWSENEKKLQAFDQYLTDDLFPLPLIGQALKIKLQNSGIESAVIDMARNTIIQNGGVLDEAELWVKDDRIYVRAANEMEGASYNGFMSGIQENIFQESAGPEIEFIEFILGKNYHVSLEN